jgi:hypothetical protein
MKSLDSSAIASEINSLNSGIRATAYENQIVVYCDTIQAVELKKVFSQMKPYSRASFRVINLKYSLAPDTIAEINQIFAQYHSNCSYYLNKIIITCDQLYIKAIDDLIADLDIYAKYVNTIYMPKLKTRADHVANLFNLMK